MAITTAHPPTPRLMYATLLLLAALALPHSTSAIWDTFPPECEDTCFERDNSHPLARCPVEVLDNVVTEAQADALVAMAEAGRAAGGGDGGVLCSWCSATAYPARHSLHHCVLLT
jgi:hypothetical protein